MHFTEPVYRNPYWPTWPLIQITLGCTHNHCKFCTIYRESGCSNLHNIPEYKCIVEFE